MRIYADQTVNLFQMAIRKPGMNQNISNQGQQPGAIRRDMAAISPQGRSAGLLANLMNQKELIQSNKDSLIQMTLDEDNSGSTAGLQEQLEEYEKQLDEIDGQIAAELAKQAEGAGEKNRTEQKTQVTKDAEPADESLASLTKQAAEFDRVQMSQQADLRREGEKRVYKAEMKLGSQAAEQKLEKAEEMERITGQIKPFLWK